MIEKGLSENGYTPAPFSLPGTIMMRWMTDQLKSALPAGASRLGCRRCDADLKISEKTLANPLRGCYNGNDKVSNW